MNMEANATDLFSSGLNCAQAVFSTYAPSYGLDADTARRVASGLGAGLGREQDVCGAVSGAILVLGLAAGYTEAADKPGKERVYAQTRELQRKFAAVHGSVLCRDPLGVDLKTAEGQAAFGNLNLTTSVCRECVATASRLTTELLKETLHD